MVISTPCTVAVWVRCPVHCRVDITHLEIGLGQWPSFSIFSSFSAQPTIRKVSKLVNFLDLSCGFSRQILPDLIEKSKLIFGDQTKYEISNMTRNVIFGWSVVNPLSSPLTNMYDRLKETFSSILAGFHIKFWFICGCQKPISEIHCYVWGRNRLEAIEQIWKIWKKNQSGNFIVVFERRGFKSQF